MLILSSINLLNDWKLCQMSLHCNNPKVNKLETLKMTAMRGSVQLLVLFFVLCGVSAKRGLQSVVDDGTILFKSGGNVKRNMQKMPVWVPHRPPPYLSLLPLRYL
jgi:hypothetical protein